MNYETIKAIIALLRTSTLTLPTSEQTINSFLAGRLYGIVVPADALFPRGYIHSRRPETAFRTGSESDRHQLINVYFAATAASADAERDLAELDALATAILDMKVATPNLVYCRREGSQPIMPQQDDRTTYLMGGGIYHCYYQDP